MEKPVSQFIDYSDRDLLVMNLANKLAGDLREVQCHQERASLVVPGGSTPGAIFDVLCAVDIDWARVDVMLSDERWVPETSERSNTKLLRERLLVNRAARARLVPLYLPYSEPEEALDELSQSCRYVLPISVLLLGMGVDMHTASLFPSADRLEEALDANAPILLPMRAEGANEPRVTLTAPMLNGALKKHLVIFGEEKRNAYEAAKLTPIKDAPVRAIMGDLVVHWAP